MDVVLRTPNGEAEVSLGPGREDTILADLVERVTGRPASQVVYIDGRAVPAATPLGTSGLLNGSTIATMDEADAPPADGRVEIVQVAGHGAGARSWLRTGRYRIGVGRRVSGDELDAAPVDSPMLEVDVDSAGAVLIRSASSRARLDGVELSADEPTAWSTGLVDVAGRAFALGRRDPRATASAGHRFAGIGVDGVSAFNRPPRLAAAAEFPPLEVPGGAEVRSIRHLGIRRGDASSRADRAAIDTFTAAARDRHDRERDRRRAQSPDLAAAVHLAEVAAPELWQRRPGHADVFQVAVGLADIDWSPALTRTQRALASAQTIVTSLGPLPMVPVTVDLLAERGVGFVGGREFGRSAVRGLLIEAAVTHGPADLDIIVLSSVERAPAWEWVKWLPHARVGGTPRILSTDDQVAGWAAAVRRSWQRPSRPAAPSHLTLVVVDEPAWWRERTAPLRSLFSDPSIPFRFVAITDTSADVPAVCTTVVTELPDHGATVDFLMDRRHIDGLHPFLATEQVALRVARRLAPLDDPDVLDVPVASDSTLPTSVSILSLLGLDDPTADVLASRWSRRTDHRAVVPIGVSDRGVLELDLDEAGPHALIAGAAGAGKSELLRSLVVGLAAQLPPDDINFVLVDFHGGSSFGACADLPHTVGVVDLDERLATRFLRCLRAELQHRLVVLRAAGASSLVEYQQLVGVVPLPRFVVVVDELASIAVELPAFVTSLVDIAQRGRSLGIHLVLATRRPAGVVDDQIRANTNLRIALRLQDDGDSLDVIGTKDAAQLPRHVPGRAYIRVGGSELTMFQSAQSTGASIDDSTVTSWDVPTHHHLDVTPYVIVRDLSPMERRLVRHADDGLVSSGSPTDLARLVEAIAGAARALGQSEQRQLSPEPLTAHLPFDRFLAEHPGDAVPYALVDLPDEQRQAPVWWSPRGDDGSLLVYGMAGAGTSSLLAVLALGIAERTAPDDVHVYCIDSDGALLAPLADLPHVGAVVGSDELDRIARLAAHLAGVLAHRTQLALERGGPAAVSSTEPSIVLLIDDVGSLRQRLGERRDLDGVWADLDRVIRDGRSLGVSAVLTAKHERAVPTSLSAQIPARLVMQLGDRVDYSAFGLQPSEIPEFVAGRAVRLDDRAEMQLVEPPASIAEAVGALATERPRDRPVTRIDPLPAHVTIDEVAGAAARTDRSIVVPVGLEIRTAAPALLAVPFGENVMVSGAAGTGRSSVLVAFAAAAQRFEPSLLTFAVAPRGGPLGSVEGIDRPDASSDVADWVDRVARSTEPRLVLVDDADRVGGPSFERLAALRDDRLIVVVAGRGDDLRTPGHWSKPLQRFRHGVLLCPGPSDGGLVRVSLGAQLARLQPRHGILVVDGVQTPLLAATVGAEPHAPSGEP